MFRFVWLLSPLVAKVFEPLAPLNGWCGGPHLYGTFISSQPRAAVTTGSLHCHGRHFGSRQPQRCWSVFRVNSAPRWDAVVPTRAAYSPIASLQFLRPSVVIMAGFKLRAWIVARGRRSTPHSLMFRFVLLLSPLVAKVSEPLASFNGWCGGPHLHGTFVSSQPRAALAAGSLLCRGHHFGSRQPQSCRGEFSGQTLPQGGALRSLLVLAIYSPIASLQFLRPLVVIMAGFKLRAWVVVRGRRTTPHSVMFCFVLLLSPLVAKMSEPLLPFNG
ncbi:hypothetical protein NDU88_000054, partial [Pleurodeles waltl]